MWLAHSIFRTRSRFYYVSIRTHVCTDLPRVKANWLKRGQAFQLSGVWYCYVRYMKIQQLLKFLSVPREAPWYWKWGCQHVQRVINSASFMWQIYQVCFKIWWLSWKQKVYEKQTKHKLATSSSTTTFILCFSWAIWIPSWLLRNPFCRQRVVQVWHVNKVTEQRKESRHFEDFNVISILLEPVQLVISMREVN